MNRTGLSVALYLCLTFFSGAAVGGFGFWMYTSRSVQAQTAGRIPPEEYRKRYVDELSTRLKLNQDQVQKLQAVLDSTRSLFRELNVKHQPEYDAIQQHQTAQIKALLDQNQQNEYERFRQEREQKRRTKRGPGEFPPK